MDDILSCDVDLLKKQIADNSKLIDECIETLEALNNRYSNESDRADI